ncbi:hypothetical protein [Streptomyces sp. NPDC020489]|uniref:hypothetical protein n=1 Tax=Streptomyces sp. NPDC020489 TaxID=3365077 RepID=UPI0037B2C30E
MNIEDFSHLWTAPPGKYVLEKYDVEGQETLPIHCPQDDAVVLIDADELIAEIAQRMIAAGVQIVDE